MGYRLDESTGLIDYDEAELLAQLYRPKLIIGGASAYTRHIDYGRLKEIANKANAYLLSDMAHISGLVAAGKRSSHSVLAHSWLLPVCQCPHFPSRGSVDLEQLQILLHSWLLLADQCPLLTRRGSDDLEQSQTRLLIYISQSGS